MMLDTYQGLWLSIKRFRAGLFHKTARPGFSCAKPRSSRFRCRSATFGRIIWRWRAVPGFD